MTTTADMVAEARREITSGHNEASNRLAQAAAAGDTSLTLKYDLAGISAGTVIAIDLEEIRVWEVAASTKQATVVERAVNGTTAAAHSSLAYVAVNPQFSNFRIAKAISQDIASLSSPSNGLFRALAVELSYNSAVAGYNLTGVTSIDDVLQVQAEVSGPSKSWPALGRHEWELRRDANTTDFASGFALLAWGGQSGRKLRVTYRAPFGALPLTTLDTDIEVTTGLHVEAHDIPPLGAIERLVPHTEIKRNRTESQPDPRRAQDVPPGARAASARPAIGMRQRRIIEERARLAARWPRRSR